MSSYKAKSDTYAYSGIVFSPLKEGNSAARGMQSWVYYAKWRKPITKMTYATRVTYIRFLNQATSSPHRPSSHPHTGDQAQVSARQVSCPRDKSPTAVAKFLDVEHWAMVDKSCGRREREHIQ